MKSFLPAGVAMILLTLASCSSKPAVDTVGEQNKELVKNFITAVFTADTAHLGDFLTEGYMQYGPGMKDSVNREQEISTWKTQWKENYSAITYDRVANLAKTVLPEENARAAGDWVMEWGTISADFKNGMPSVKFNIHLAFRITNGKIDREFDYYDLADILEQQGFEFVPPANQGTAK